MQRGMISNIGKMVVWVMSDVLLAGDVLRADRADWLDRTTLVVDVVIIIKPGRPIPDLPYEVSYRVFRDLADAQRALKQDPRPMFIIAETVNDLANETWAFQDNVISRYSIGRR